MTEPDEVEVRTVAAEWRVRIEPNVMLDGLSILLGRLVTTETSRERYQVFYRHEYTHAEQPLAEGEAIRNPSLVLDEELAKVLYAALADHYGHHIPTLREEFRELRAVVEKAIAPARPYLASAT